MKFFKSKSTISPGQGGKDFRVVRTAEYVEMEFVNEDGYSFYIYLFPKEGNSYHVASFWENIFDPIVAYLNEETGGIIRRDWPAFTLYSFNYVNNDYDSGALVNLHDADAGKNYWFLTTLIHGLVEVPTTTYDVIDHPKLKDALSLIMQKSEILLEEIDRNS